MAVDAVSLCPVCLRSYRDPQLLGPCGHSFCKVCVDQLRSFVCPVCRTPFRSSDVRKNFALARMLEAPQPSAPPGTSNEACSQELRRTQALSGTSSASETIGGHDSINRVVRGLTSFGIPFGLAQLIGEEDRLIGLRVFILDNSGSTSYYDGRVLEPHRRGDQATKFTQCSRWNEICHMAMTQAELNVHLGVPCEFVLLNPPSSRPFGAFREGVDFVSVNERLGNTDVQLASLKSMLTQTQPNGPTPLFERISEIRERLKRDYSHSTNQGLRFIVVVATDGLPTAPGCFAPTDAAKHQFVDAIRRLTSELPVFVVVRLCTDEDGVVEFYNTVDAEDELSLEVIDDLQSEAREIVATGNGWLTYSPQLHAIREGGTFVKLLDLLDERRLTPLETRVLAAHVLQKEDETLMSVACDTHTFARLAQERLRKLPLVYDSIHDHFSPCLDIGKLRRAAASRGGRDGCWRGVMSLVWP